MNTRALLLKMLPGFIPLLVFIIADEIWGTEIGLIVAVTVGVLEMAYTWLREKRIDRFILFDTGLIVLLGGVSIALHDDLFFKLKPGLVELILCLILAVSVWSPLNIVGGMTQRYMKGIEMNEAQVTQMQRSLKAMFFIFLFHTILVFYSAWFMSKEAWAFISGGLFYIIFAVYFAFEWLKQRFQLKKQQSSLIDEEWLPLVNNEGQIIGKAPRSACHKGEKVLHPVVHLHVLNNAKHLFLQKRPMNKLVQPGKWDTAVGGHISYGEDLETALKREAFEEIGLENFSAKHVTTYKWESDIEAELVYVFVTYDYKNIRIYSDEVEEGKFWSPNQLKRNMGKEVFTPNFEYEYQMLKGKVF